MTISPPPRRPPIVVGTPEMVLVIRRDPADAALCAEEDRLARELQGPYADVPSYDCGSIDLTARHVDD